MIFNAMKLDEIIKGVGVDRKEESPRMEPRGGSKLFRCSAITKNTCNCPGIYKDQSYQPADSMAV